MTSVQWMILAHEQVVTEYFFFFSSSEGSKWIRISVYLFIASFLCKI